MNGFHSNGGRVLATLLHSAFEWNRGGGRNEVLKNNKCYWHLSSGSKCQFLCERVMGTIGSRSHAQKLRDTESRACHWCDFSSTKKLFGES